MCPSGIGTPQQEREVLLQTGSMSFDRRSLDVPVAWQQQLTDVAPGLKWLETIGLLSRCLAITNSSHQGLCCSYRCFSHKQSDNNKTAGAWSQQKQAGFYIFYKWATCPGFNLRGTTPETSSLKWFVCPRHWQRLYLTQGHTVKYDFSNNHHDNVRIVTNLLCYIFGWLHRLHHVLKFKVCFDKADNFVTLSRYSTYSLDM